MITGHNQKSSISDQRVKIGTRSLDLEQESTLSIDDIQEALAFLRTQQARVIKA
eukprot:CAMPEP_0198151756 /NCGR_PEP_ID=MMETSP1443-20131203/56988_1 /TAXON_ID=186043 /ORGANISM="Entomoneis sp., Strain CCMP2396" /LENGTH=53 /DNA_ID=CAMNT_0043817539 /DNA_START=53 /DNA_END=211 /DNA_ORIENTATION=+